MVAFQLYPPLRKKDLSQLSSATFSTCIEPILNVVIIASIRLWLSFSTTEWPICNASRLLAIIHIEMLITWLFRPCKLSRSCDQTKICKQSKVTFKCRDYQISANITLKKMWKAERSAWQVSHRSVVRLCTLKRYAFLVSFESVRGILWRQGFILSLVIT